MSRRLWVAGWLAVAGGWSSVLVLALLGTWVLGWRGWATAGVIALATLSGNVAMFVWTDQARPERALPRAERRRVAAERARIRADQVIAELEREAGLS